MIDPIYNVKPVDVFTLHANHWNPNFVFSKELELLEESILLDGWLQPITINTNLMIIDGFHRASLAKSSQAILDRDAGLVPCVILDKSDREAMMMTVRINRSKGTHTASKMVDLVQTLVDEYDVTPEEMIQKMGMTEGEVALLYDGSLLKRRKLDSHQYSRAWIPVETRLLTPEQKEELEKQAFEREEDADS